MHLSLVQPSGRLTGRWPRVFAVAAYGVTAVITLASALVRDPFLDQHCWSNCHDNTFLVHADQDTARALAGIGLRATIVIATIAAVGCVVRLVKATPVARRVMSYIVIPTGAALVATVVNAVVLIADPAENPERNPFVTLFFLRATTLAVLAVGVGAGRRPRLAHGTRGGPTR